MDRPEPPAQSAARTSSARQRRANRAVLTAQCGCPGFQGLPAEHQPPAQQRRGAVETAGFEERPPNDGPGLALGPASRPGTGANPARNPGPAPQNPDRQISPFSGNLGRFPSNPGPWVQTPPGPPSNRSGPGAPRTCIRTKAPRARRQSLKAQCQNDARTGGTGEY